MRLILSYLFFSTITLSALAQQSPNAPKPADSVSLSAKKQNSNKVPKSFYIPTGIRVGTDLVALGVNAFGQNRNRYEFQADIDFHRIYLVGSYGLTNYSIQEESFSYDHQGSYYRVGLEADFLKFDPDHNTLTFGVRYARANFSENLSTNLVSPIYGAYGGDFRNEAVKARWFELTSSLRIMLLKNLYTGYTFRIQLNSRVFDADEFRAYDIPGFGRAQFRNRWAFNYYVAYRIAWKEKGVMKRSR